MRSSARAYPCSDLLKRSRAHETESRRHACLIVYAAAIYPLGLDATKKSKLRTERGMPTMNGHITQTSDASFELDVVKSDKRVLLDFWAEWCRPCKMIEPIHDEVAQDYADRVQIAKMNVDEHHFMAVRFGVRGIPTLILFKNGAVAARVVGALSKLQLTAFLDRNL